jgi:hypothetical protein
MIHRWKGALTVAALGLGAAGCAAAAEPTVGAAAGQFAEALARHDGAAACTMLTDNARQEAETFGRSCPAQLVTLPDPGAVQGVEVWGDTAQAHLAGDTVFLLRFPDGWRVSAAGCTPQGDAPYQCEVRG